MKIKKKLWILTIILLISIVANSCGDDEEQSKPTCSEACPEIQRDHLGINENCNHNGKIINGICECTEQIIKLQDEYININILKQAGVSVIQMNTAIVAINSVYDWFDGTERTNFALIVTEIHITSGSVVSFLNDILEVGYEAEDWEIYSCTIDLVNPSK